MKKYLIERHIPGVHKFSAAEYAGATEVSNAALAKLAPDHYAMVTVTAVTDGDLAGLDAATRQNLLKQLADARGEVEARAYLQGLRKQYTVKVAEDRL